MKLWLKNNTNEEWEQFHKQLQSDQIKIARCISVDNPSQINMNNLGRHWTSIDHWCSYGQNLLPYFKVYCVTAETDYDNIEWNMSREMFLKFDDEYELYVIDYSKLRNIKIYEVNPDCTLGKEVTDEVV